MRAKHYDRDVGFKQLTFDETHAYPCSLLDHAALSVSRLDELQLLANIYCIHVTVPTSGAHSAFTSYPRRGDPPRHSERT